MRTLNFISVVLFSITANAIEYSSISVPESAITLIPQNTFNAESIVISNDETEICWIGEKKNTKLPPNDIYRKSLVGSDSETRIKKPFSKTLNLFTKCSFTSDKTIVTDELEYRFGAIIRSLVAFVKTKDWEPVGYHSTVSFYHQNTKQEELDPFTFNLPKNTLIEHPRVSVDGKILTFYIEGNPKTEGIYIYDMVNNKLHYLGNHLDKHPTFNSDGSHIVFHHQGKMKNGTEIAELGYYNINTTKGFQIERVLLNKTRTFGSDFTYEKHPAEHTPLGLVFFHGQDSVDGKKFIGVRSLNHPGKVFELKMKYQGLKIKKAKHPAVAAKADSALYFVGKVEGTDRDQIFKLDHSALVEIQKQF